MCMLSLLDYITIHAQSSKESLQIRLYRTLQEVDVGSKTFFVIVGLDTVCVVSVASEKKP